MQAPWEPSLRRAAGCTLQRPTIRGAVLGRCVRPAITESSVGSLQQLKDNIEEAIVTCDREGGVWKKLYYGSRAALILFATLTSADALAALGLLKGAQPVFAILVTLITAYDVWLTPGAKYRGLYVANDDYAALEGDTALLSPDDKEGIRKAWQEYSAINRRLQKALMP